MPFIVTESPACPASKQWAVFTETAHGSGKTTGKPHGCHPSRKAALRQAAALYKNVPEASRSQAPPPPNLDEAENGSTECCGTCHMFDGGVCWGYGNHPVEADQVCDSYSPEPDGERSEAMTAISELPAPLASHTRDWRAQRAKALSNDERRRSERREVRVPLELREEVRKTDPATGEQAGIRTLRSYASLFDTPYNIGSSGYRYEESVKRGAFKRSLGRTPDVVFRYDHSGPPLARSSSGTLRLGEDERGLWYEADLNTNDPDVQALIPKIERKDLTESSFAFRCIKDDWNDDFTTRSLEECELDRGDVSVVTFGASRATGRHMLLRSEDLAEVLDGGFERFLEAWTEWRDYTLLPVEKRVGKVISGQSMETLRKVLGLFATADDAVDEGQALLSDLMGVPNPNERGEGDEGEGGDVTSSEQLDHVRSEGRDASDGDRERTAPHLLDAALVDLGHLHRHVERLANDEVQKNLESLGFNQDHAMRHVVSAQDHVQKLGVHLEEHPSDPQTFRDEREKLTSMRSEENDDVLSESRDEDAQIAQGLQKLRDQMQDLMVLQHQDSGSETDPADAEVWAHMEGMKKLLDEAIIDQAKDMATEGPNGRSEDEKPEDVRVPIDAGELEEAIAALRAQPTDSDYGVMQALKEAKLVLAHVKAKQLADPDHETDPDDAAVMDKINAAEAAVDAAIVAQSKDGRYEEENGDRSESEEEDVAATLADVIAAKSAIADVIVAADADDERHDAASWDLLEDAERSLQRAINHDGDDDDGEDEYWLRSQRSIPKEFRVDLSAAGRQKMASEGVAMPDGSFPVPSTEFLRKAIRAYGRAKDKAAVKAFLVRRAKALGATSLLPESWRSEPFVGIDSLPGNDSEELLLAAKWLSLQ